MDELSERRMQMTRGRLLKLAGGGAATVGLVSLPGCGGDDETAIESSVADANVNAPQIRNYPHIPLQPPMNCSLLEFFTREEGLDVEAFTARLIPGSPDDPGAREGCVVAYIDHKLARYDTFATTTYFRPPFAELAKDHPPGFDDGTIYIDEEQLPRYGFQSSLTPQKAYRLGLAELDRYSQKTHGAPFRALSEPTQDDIVSKLEEDKIESFEKPTGKQVFDMLLEDTYEGMFGDPIYHGNRDFAGWRLIGYPGAQRAYTSYELKNGPNERTIQSLAEMQAMHPGRVDEHVILPIQGTRRLARRKG